MNPLARFASLSALLLAAACSTPSTSANSSASTPAANSELPAPLARATTSASNTASAPDVAPTKHPYALDQVAFQQLVKSLSEPDAEFFSDNFISNETSYLQPAAALAERPTGGVYIGVGPEQNFSYIALTKPDRAYIVDIRRDNLVLHLLYKAAFDVASSRAHFLALLTGRPFDASKDAAAAAGIEQVMAASEAQPASEASFGAAHKQLREQVSRYGVPLTAADERSFKQAHEAFYRGGLDLRFTLKQNSVRRYPTMRELLAQQTPEGQHAGFLASADAFAYVQQMQRDNRIVPLVGDFAGDGALPRLAAHLNQEKLVVRSFYVSNVEQYLLADGVWWKWQRNIAALPSDANSVFIRGYLDQGKRHPQQLAGHRTATTLHAMEAFKQRSKPYPSMWALASDGVLPAAGPKVADAGR